LDSELIRYNVYIINGRTALTKMEEGKNTKITKILDIKYSILKYF